VAEFIQTLQDRARVVHDNQSERIDWTLSESKPAADKSKGKGKAADAPPLAWLHCSVGARLEPHQEDDGGQRSVSCDYYYVD